MLCVISNSGAPAGAGPVMAARRGCAAQEQKRSPTRTTAGNPNIRGFTIDWLRVNRNLFDLFDLKIGINGFKPIVARTDCH